MRRELKNYKKKLAYFFMLWYSYSVEAGCSFDTPAWFPKMSISLFVKSGQNPLFNFERKVFVLKITERVASLVEAKIEELGFRLWDVEFNKEYGSWELLITIDREDPVTLEDCELVSRAVEPILDEADPIEQAYLLTVSSVGLDRALKLAKDFDRHLGDEVDVKLYTAPKDKAMGASKNFKAKLVSHDDLNFTVETEKGSFTLPKKAAALIRPHIDF